MSVYTKDEINFHGFLKAIREMQKKSLSTLGRGLYCPSMIARIETGERLPKKLERDRIVARLGVSGEGYEDYLSREEYTEWVLRQEILGCIKEKEFSTIEDLLERFAAIPKIGKVEKQFLEAMRFMYLKLKGESEEKLRPVIERAVSYTIPDVKKGFRKKLLLSDQEINLLIEYVSLYYYSDDESEQRDWKLKRYADVDNYVQQSCIDDIGKTKVVPKLVYYVCLTHLEKTVPVDEMRYCLNLCNDAIELLRDTKKMYYFIELLEMRQTLIGLIIDQDALLKEDEAEELKKVAVTSKAWAETLVGLYHKYEISPYMDDFTYLYIETESYNTNEVVRLRRKMYGYTQEELAKGVCSARTVVRAERDEISLQRFDLKGLFEKLGLCPEYVRANVISHDPEAFILRRKIARYSNSRDLEKWAPALDKLESMLNMDIIHNKQAIARSRVLLDEYTQKLSRDIVVERLKEVLEVTMPIEGLLKSKKWYLTVEEISCLHNIAVRIDKNQKNDYFMILNKYCEMTLNNQNVMKRLSVNDLLVTGIASYLGNLGEYVASTELGEQMIKINLASRRMRTLARNLYNTCWNKYNIDGTDRLTRDCEEVKETLSKCILLSEIIDDEKLINIFINKLND